MRIIQALALVSSLAMSGAAFAQTAAVDVDIKPQSLAAALRELGAQTGVQILFRAEDVSRGKPSPAVHGKLSPQEALERLLTNTRLKYEFVNEHTVRISAAVETPPTSASHPSSATSSQATDDPPGAEGGGRNNASNGSTSSSEASQTSEPKLEEILVTAQKKSERLQDVPVPVSVLNADALANSGQVLIRDYFSTVPGLNLTPALGGGQFLSIRGVISGQYTNPTVGVVIDDVPYGSSLSYNNIPDFDPGDLARIEVLRGPQGTLYGASSMGGLIKYVTRDPSTDGLSGRIEVGTSDVYNGAEPGFNIRGSLNIPLGEELAMRVSGFRRQDPGYVDDILDGRKGVNETQADGARLAALWRPSESLSLKVSGLYQSIRSLGTPDVLIGPGYVGLQDNFVPETGGTDRTVQAYSATLKAKVGSVDLISLTGYNINKDTDNEDDTSLYGQCCTAPLNLGVIGTVLINNEKTSKFTQELRASVPISEKFEWLLGGFYTHESTAFDQHLLAENQDTGAFVTQTALFVSPITYQEYAGFTDLTYRVTDRFDIQVGGRESHITTTQDAGYNIDPEFGSPALKTSPQLTSSANAFTYLVTPSFKVHQNLMVYGRFASGYRAGGPNGVIDPSTPPAYKPDKTENYEFGVKGDFFDHTLTTDLSLYYIDWSNIEIHLNGPPPVKPAYIGNGSAAKSQGVEASVEARPLDGLTVAGWFAYTDAELTKAFPENSPAYGVAGDRLPFSSRYSGNFSLEQNFPLGGNATGFVGGLVSYVGNRIGLFQFNAVRQYYPAYTRADLHAGIRYDSWTANIFVNNVGDVRGVSNGGIGYIYPNAFIYIQPRTIGVSLAKAF